jgi:hypothetical protein
MDILSAVRDGFVALGCLERRPARGTKTDDSVAVPVADGPCIEAITAEVHSNIGGHTAMPSEPATSELVEFKISVDDCDPAVMSSPENIVCSFSHLSGLCAGSKDKANLTAIWCDERDFAHAMPAFTLKQLENFMKLLRAGMQQYRIATVHQDRQLAICLHTRWREDFYAAINCPFYASLERYREGRAVGLKVGNYLRIPAFTSTSSSERATRKFISGNMYKISVIHDIAVDISDVSTVFNELEVLLIPPCAFQITDICWNGTTTTTALVITLCSVECNFSYLSRQLPSQERSCICGPACPAASSTTDRDEDEEYDCVDLSDVESNYGAGNGWCYRNAVMKVRVFHFRSSNFACR